jgi:SAM-dependent methyltransferase
VFDLAYSIGVVHHLPDPEEGLASLARVVGPGGTLFAWVYGHEHNGFVRRVVDPVRRHVTSRMPPSVMRVVALPLAAAFHAVVRLVYRPLRGTRPGRRLPLSDYLTSVGGFSFRQNYNIVFDQLVAPTAHYVRGDELRGWLERAGLRDVEISPRNRNSWRGRGVRPA